MFKGFTAEGGIRSPAIISYPKARSTIAVSPVLASVKDLAPTFLEMAGVKLPSVDAKGRAVQVLQGRSMWTYLSGHAEHVHAPDEVLGMELFGRTMLRQGDWKLSWDNKPWGDGSWALYNLRSDPGERRNVIRDQPQKAQELMGLWKGWSQTNNVLFEEGLADKFEYTNTRRYYETLGQGRP